MKFQVANGVTGNINGVMGYIDGVTWELSPIVNRSTGEVVAFVPITPIDRECYITRADKVAEALNQYAVCEVCGDTEDFSLHLPKDKCTGCRAPHEHHEFKAKL